jgi:hypothetical protein
LVTGRIPELKQCVTSQTPVDATEWLREHSPVGQVFNTYEWGDYLVWAGPPNLPVFVTSQAHLVFPEIWRDYLAVIRVASGWEKILDTYGVETVVVDKLGRVALIRKLRNDTRWSVAFEDDVAVVFVRKSSQAGSQAGVGKPYRATPQSPRANEGRRRAWRRDFRKAATPLTALLRDQYRPRR